MIRYTSSLAVPILDRATVTEESYMVIELGVFAGANRKYFYLEQLSGHVGVTSVCGLHARNWCSIVVRHGTEDVTGHCVSAYMVLEYKP